MTFNPQIDYTLIIIMLVAGFLNCFFGRRFLKVILIFWGFIMGAGLVGYLFFNFFQSNQTIAYAAAIIGGILGASLLGAFVKVGVFALGALLGYTVGSVLASTGQIPPQLPILLGLGFVGGVLALFMERTVIILATALSGAWLIMLGLASFLGTQFNLLSIIKEPIILQQLDRKYLILFLIWVFLSLFGTWIQFQMTRPGKKSN
jgi:hypothetical protein